MNYIVPTHDYVNNLDYHMNCYKKMTLIKERKIFYMYDVNVRNFELVSMWLVSMWLGSCAVIFTSPAAGGPRPPGGSGLSLRSAAGPRRVHRP